MRPGETISVPHSRAGRLGSRLLLGGLLLVLLFIHLGDPATFSRQLIVYDDHEFIAPLRDLSVSTYLTDYLTRPDRYAFPLRDLTFGWDFLLGRWTGKSTFWLTNLLVFVLVLGLWYRLFKQLAPKRPLLPEAMVAFVALHPVMVELVQWASNRKHLLVAAGVLLGSVRAFDLYRRKAAPSPRDWLFFLACYVAIWLCWPSGVLWILWVHAMFWKESRRDPRRWVWLACSCATLVAALYLSGTRNSSYASAPGSFDSLASFVRAAHFGIESLGRGAFTLLVPFWLAPYYKLWAWQNWVGLGILLAGAVLIVRQFRRASAPRRDLVSRILLLWAALFVPQGLVFLTYSNFVWADRYLNLTVPLVALVVVLLWIDPTADPEKAVARKKSKRAPKAASASHAPVTAPVGPARWVPAGILLAATPVCAVLSASLVPAWKTDVALFDRCVRTEGSPACVQLAIEKHFDLNECADLEPLLAKARQLSAQSPWPYESSFRTQVPLYEGFCLAAGKAPYEKKLQELQEIWKRYPVPYYSIPGEILIHLSSRNTASAYERAYATYLDPSTLIPEAAPKLMSILRGQAEALCTLAQMLPLQPGSAAADPQAAQGCRVRLEQFDRRTVGVGTTQQQIGWAFQRTLAAFNQSSQKPATATGRE